MPHKRAGLVPVYNELFDLANLGRLADMDSNMNGIGRYSVDMGWMHMLLHFITVL